ncbi:MAG: phosphate acyltransferase PlsX [Eggerthellaceae bacterium]|nr:phosphate acyltransferase PlsX [Eggerthellaceae bacterium]
MPNTVIAVDVMGGDFAPDVVVEGIAAALAEDPNLEVLACGLPEVVEPLAGERCRALAASQVIDMEEHPANAVRAKKDSSIVVGCKAVKAGEADGFYSAGSTGAVLVAATLHIGRIRRISRPMLGTVIPSATGPVLLCDVGANADCKPEYLSQFGLMGEAYMRSIFGVEAPKVGLLNIGEEDTKGSAFAQETNALMHAQLPSFVGNAQGRDITGGGFDVIVTDGFTGNVVLKTIEGSMKYLFKCIKSSLLSSFKSKIGALLIKNSLSGLKEQFNPDAYGGAPLIGVAGACCIGHGSSNAQAIKNGILMTARMVRSDLTGNIVRGLDAIDAAKATAETDGPAAQPEA